MDGLREELTEIRGVGPATAEEIIATIDQHGVGEEAVDDAVTQAIADAADSLETGLEYFASDRAEFARQHVEDAYRTLDTIEA